MNIFLNYIFKTCARTPRFLVTTHASIHSGWNRGRSPFKEFVEATSLVGKPLAVALAKRSKKWENQDRSIALTMAIFDSVRDAAGARLFENLILRALPSEERPRSMEQIMQAMNGLREHGLFKFGGVDAKSALEAVVACVGKIRGGEVIDYALLKADTFMSNIIDRCALLCTIDIVKEGSQPKAQRTKTLKGETAAKHLMAALEEKATTTQLIGHDEITKVRGFSWLLTPQHKAALELMAKQAAEAGTGGVKRKIAAISSRSGAASSSSKACKASNDLNAEGMSDAVAALLS